NSPRALAEASEAVFTSLPVPADVEAVALGPNGLIEGMKPDTACFDMSTSSVAVVRKINAAFAEKNLSMLGSPVSGGPGGAASGKMAIWVGGDEQQFNRHKGVLDAMGDQAKYIGPIGAGTIAKLVHNCTSAVMNVALAEVFTMGIKAGVEPLDLGEAVRQGATGRARTFDRLGKFLSGTYDPADFALRLLHKDVSLAVGLGKEVGVPMRLANLALEELTEALNRGWSTRDSRVGMLLQVERSKITPPAAEPGNRPRHQRALRVSRRLGRACRAARGWLGRGDPLGPSGLAGGPRGECGQRTRNQRAVALPRPRYRAADADSDAAEHAGPRL